MRPKNEEGKCLFESSQVGVKSKSGVWGCASGAES